MVAKNIIWVWYNLYVGTCVQVSNNYYFLHKTIGNSNNNKNYSYNTATVQFYNDVFTLYDRADVGIVDDRSSATV